MTVCIAAICAWNQQRMIVGASDRMLTAGDIEFEPPQTKIFGFGLGHVTALVAGDTAAQTEICFKVQQEVMARTVAYVPEIADIYAREFASYRRKQAEQALLIPIGLTLDDFIKRQREIPAQVVAMISEELRSSEIEAEAIITGIDANGAHIYVVRDPGLAVCNDSVGFAAIGIGEWHAQSQFMFARYTNIWSFPRAAVLTYSAKKRAEVAPGVGRDTDMFFIGPGLSPYTLILPELQTKIDEIYEDTQTREKDIQEKAHGKFEKYVEEILKRAAERQTDGVGDAEPSDNET